MTMAPAPVVDVTTPPNAGETSSETPADPVAAPVAATGTHRTAEATRASAAAAGAAAIRNGIAARDDSTAGRAVGAAGATDNALRKGELAPLDPSDSKWRRFAQAVEGARANTSRTLTSDSYTGPDGITVYRFRHNGRTWCRTGGDIKPSPFGAQAGGQTLFDTGGGGGAAGIIACPSGVRFKRD